MMSPAAPSVRMVTIQVQRMRNLGQPGNLRARDNISRFSRKVLVTFSDYTECCCLRCPGCNKTGASYKCHWKVQFSRTIRSSDLVAGIRLRVVSLLGYPGEDSFLSFRSGGLQHKSWEARGGRGLDALVIRCAVIGWPSMDYGLHLSSMEAPLP